MTNSYRYSNFSNLLTYRMHKSQISGRLTDSESFAKQASNNSSF
jgi:hypothetical protein